MSNDELVDAFEDETMLQMYSSRIGRFVEGRVFVLHWPVAPDAFLVEVISSTNDTAEYGGFYWIQRSDPTLIIKTA
jgi:hypothetical protein